MTTRKELVEALRLRYCSAAFSDRIKILDEFVALTCYHCYHRKHANGVLRGEFSPATEVRLRNRVDDEAVAQALTVLWEAADRVCGKRLKPLIPMLVDAMERHGHLDLDPAIKTKVLQVNAALQPLAGVAGLDVADPHIARDQIAGHAGNFQVKELLLSSSCRSSCINSRSWRKFLHLDGRKKGPSG